MVLFVNLLSSIILTIVTPPGGIPKEKEWDINEEAVVPYTDSDGRWEDSFDNQEICEDSTAPRAQVHFDYRFIKSYAGPVYPPEETDSFIERKNANTALYVPVSHERKKMGGIRMCQRCLQTKPDRTHHCSQCNQCVLKMDHHCPWCV